jgi:hypothetical protein
MTRGIDRTPRAKATTLKKVACEGVVVSIKPSSSCLDVLSNVISSTLTRNDEIATPFSVKVDLFELSHGSKSPQSSIEPFGKYARPIVNDFLNLALPSFTHGSYIPAAFTSITIVPENVNNNKGNQLADASKENIFIVIFVVSRACVFVKCHTSVYLTSQKLERLIEKITHRTLKLTNFHQFLYRHNNTKYMPDANISSII